MLQLYKNSAMLKSFFKEKLAYWFWSIGCYYKIEHFTVLLHLNSSCVYTFQKK